MNEKNIGIVGYGHVGKAMHDLFKGKIKAIYDPVFNEDIGLPNSKESFTSVSTAIICVPTPMAEEGYCDVSLVDDSVAWLIKTNPDIKILIKSTIAVGTTDMLSKKYGVKSLAFSPEYFGESKYYNEYDNDVRAWPFVIVGATEESFAIELIDLFEKTMGPTRHYYKTTPKTAELTKYMENVFYATKVIFCNEFYDVAKTFGVDYHELRELWLADPRISPWHTSVFPQTRGFSGKCFPKDLSGLIESCKKEGYNPELIMKVQELNNEKFLKMNKD